MANENKVNGEKIFKDSKDTHGETYKHSWGYDAAVEDLTKLKTEFDKLWKQDLY